MKTVDDYETIRRAYFVEKQSIRAIHRQLGYDRDTIRKAITSPAPQRYQLKKPRAAPVLGPYQTRLIELLAESAAQPRKQRYTAHKIFELLQREGYAGSEGAVHNFVSQHRQPGKRPAAYLPLEFDPGQDAQVDWGEAEVELAGVRVRVHLFIMRLNYSRVRFVMAFPFQKQEAFLSGHIQAFHFLGGVPHRITYDNLKTAVYQILTGHSRLEQQAFKTFRSYYLFESHFCTPAQGHEKGGVESDVGYVQRNFMAPIPQVSSYAELNTALQEACLQNVQRHVRGQAPNVAALWEAEKAALLPLPPRDYPACRSYPVKANGYSQVALDTNRYSIPVAYQARQLVLEAYPFQIRVLSDHQVIAEHARCFAREQDILDPLHYWPLLEQRPGAFEHAKPVRQWRKTWPPVYEQLLATLQESAPDGRGVREFIAILKLHHQYPAALLEQAVQRALALGAAHLDGVQLCLRHLQAPSPVFASLDLRTQAHLLPFGQQPVNLQQYDQLLR